MLVIILLGLMSTSKALSLLDLHDDEVSLRTYTKDNVENNDDGTISFKDYHDYDNDVVPIAKNYGMSDSKTKTNNGRSKSIPLIEAPVAMSNPIWKIFSRASDLYRMFRRSPSTTLEPHYYNVPYVTIPETKAPTSSSSTSLFSKKVTRNPRRWQLFL